jgi:hypothetical protein
MAYERRRASVGPFGAMMSGVAVGAGLMYLLDPDAGRRRRAAARDKWTHEKHEVREAIEATRKDAGHRLHGWMVELQGSLHPETVTDDVLAERVRARMGRVISHPRAVEVSVDGGVVTLGGHVLRREASALVAGVYRVRGVHDVVNRLNLHDQAGGIGELTGPGHRGARHPLLQKRWSPSVRLLVAVVGGSLLAATLAARRGRGWVLFGALVATLARSAGLAEGPAAGPETLAPPPDPTRPQA